MKQFRLKILKQLDPYIYEHVITNNFSDVSIQFLTEDTIAGEFFRLDEMDYKISGKLDYYYEVNRYAFENADYCTRNGYIVGKEPYIHPEDIYIDFPDIFLLIKYDDRGNIDENKTIENDKIKKLKKKAKDLKIERKKMNELAASYKYYMTSFDKAPSI